MTDTRSELRFDKTLAPISPFRNPGAWWFGPLAKAHNIITSLSWKWLNWRIQSILFSWHLSFNKNPACYLMWHPEKRKTQNSQQYNGNALLNHIWSSFTLTSTSEFRKTILFPQLQGRHSCASKSPWRWSTCPRARSVRSRTWRSRSSLMVGVMAPLRVVAEKIYIIIEIMMQASWWIQPNWNIFCQIGNLPQIGMKINKYLKPPPSITFLIVKENRWEMMRIVVHDSCYV